MGDRKYILSIYRVLVQDKFLRHEAKKPHNEYIRKLQNINIKRVIGLPQSLPAKKTDEVLNNPTTNKLYRKFRQLRE